MLTIKRLFGLTTKISFFVFMAASLFRFIAIDSSLTAWWVSLATCSVSGALMLLAHIFVILSERATKVNGNE